MGTGTSLFFWFLTFVLVVFLIVFGIYHYYTNYTYEREIGAYFDNARDCITPECILEQLQDGKQAIINAGLNENDYGAFIFKKPDNSMKFQYTHLNSIIERAEAVKQWKEQVYSNQSSGETMKDVYNEKMDNLRNYIHAEGYRSDWIAEDTWFIKYHIFLHFSFIIYVLLTILIFIFGTLGGALWEY